jgi:Na+-driven multidrug efflux pump
MVVFVTCGLILILALARDTIVGFYTSDEDIKAKAIEALGIFCVALVPDCVIYSQMGAFRGLGQ